jgi:hypothetical protein
MWNWKMIEEFLKIEAIQGYDYRGLTGGRT